MEGPLSPGVIQKRKDALDKGQLPYALLSSEELSSRYPQMTFQGDYKAILDPTAGVLQPMTCLSALQASPKE